MADVGVHSGISITKSSLTSSELLNSVDLLKIVLFLICKDLDSDDISGRDLLICIPWHNFFLTASS